MLCRKYDEKLINSRCVAQEKYDGFRACMEISLNGTRIFLSRDEHEVTHLLPELANICGNNHVLDGELLSPDGEFKHLAGLCGANTLESTAEKNREKYGHPRFVAFDCMEWHGINVTKKSFGERWIMANTLVDDDSINNNLISIAPIYYPTNFVDFAKELMKQGEEGIVVRDLDSPYKCGKRTMLKIKGETTYDVVVMGYAPPTKEYKGKSKTWQYWEDDYGNLFEISVPTSDTYSNHPVTKPYFYGYPGAVEFGVYRDGQLVKVGECRGFTDEVAKMFRDSSMIGKVIEVTAQGIIDRNTGSLRHPRFNRFRYDKKSEECTWEEYVND